MSKRNDDFFDSKKDWSRVKDTLLASYLPVYFAKVIHTKKPIVYIDCFAGAGKFGDGEDGSPRIALKERNSAIEHSSRDDAKIDMYFIDPIYADALTTNIADLIRADGHGVVKVIKGTYEESVPKILSSVTDANVFLYVDPFGIKYLGNRIFANACANFKGNVELLLNLNSFGFIREACRVTGAEYYGEHVDLEERDESVLETTSAAEELLTAIAGGDYWKGIIEAYRQDRSAAPNPSLTAEKNFSSAYRCSLSQACDGPFRYVLDIPIRIKKGSHPKYRMVYGTNHPDGCIAMADNMIRRADELYTEIQSGGQMSLFPTDVNQELTVPVPLLRERLLSIIDRRSDNIEEQFCKAIGKPVTKTFSMSVRLHQLLADFFCEYGVVCKRSDLVASLRNLETDGVIVVDRDPAQTEKGKPSKFWSEDNHQTVWVRRKGDRV